MDTFRLELTIKRLSGLLAANLEQLAACRAHLPLNPHLLMTLMEEQLILQNLIIIALSTYIGDDPTLSAIFDQGIFNIQLAELLGSNRIIASS